ncbi:Hsp20/alpha crystallin family protein [Ferviditalea candida]|uniref:Hsp20/alpha crystallin family protein n=1 Tax=Ferviditalea candida TaxID=3108399 RepID=A0ABU5ZLR1_9BACL|nr:Hsp20/alpha crystallin family protein [Paenibacillaceae bacterium T2]
MVMIPYEPFRHLEHWKRDFDRFFNEFPSFLRAENNLPRMDVYETEKEVVATCEIPGLEKKEDIHIDVNEDRLEIGGVFQGTTNVENEQMHRKERFSGRFQRLVTLPAHVKNEGVTASYKNGILEIHMPKAEPHAKKRIDIQFH